MITKLEDEIETLKKVKKDGKDDKKGNEEKAVPSWYYQRLNEKMMVRIKLTFTSKLIY